MPLKDETKKGFKSLKKTGLLKNGKPKILPRERRPSSTMTDLEVSELRYRRLFEAAKDGILIIDYYTGMILDVNRFLIDLLGYPKDCFIEKHLWEVGPFKDVLESKSKFLELKKKKYIRYEDLPLQTKSGKRIEVEFVSNVYMVNNEYTIQCNIRDITLRQKAEATLREAKEMAENINAAKSDFLMNVSHDIRTPVSVIKGFADLLMKTPLSEEQEKFCMVIQKKVIELFSLVGRVIDVSVIEKGKGHIHNSSFSIREIMKDIQETCNLLIGNKNVEFKVDIAESIPERLWGDDLRIKQVLENLCGNAVKYTEKGKVGVTINADGKRLGRKFLDIYFLVEDTGRGMHKEQLSEIFEPYTRFHESGQKIDGEGLGLHIVKTLVKEMGGKIDVSSEEGEGSKFSFVLNMMDTETFSGVDAEKRTEDNKEESMRLSGMNILVAEDDEDNRELVGCILKDTGCKFQFVVNGQQVLEEMVKNKYNLILMDIRMPVIDGFDAAKAVRKNIDKSVPIIALTANMVEGIEDKCKQAGMNGCIVKPLDIDTLVKTIKNV